VIVVLAIFYCPGAAPRPACVMLRRPGRGGGGSASTVQLRSSELCQTGGGRGISAVLGTGHRLAHRRLQLSGRRILRIAQLMPFGLSAYLLAASPYRLGQPPRPARSWRPPPRLGPDLLTLTRTLRVSY